MAEQYRKIYVLLTQFRDFSAKAIKFFSNCNYTHASIGLEEDMDKFYSFKLKGFKVESVTRYLKGNHQPFKCCLYELEVLESVYNKIKETIQGFLSNKENLNYSSLGLVLCFLHIPFKRKNHYFCSQFVAKVLKDSSVLKTKRPSSLFLPKHLGKLRNSRRCYNGDLLGLANHYGLQYFV